MTRAVSKVVRTMKAITLILVAAMSTGFLFAQQPPSRQEDQNTLFNKLELASAWKITKGDPNVLVGIIDNGFDFFHPDMKGQLIPGDYYSGGYHTEFCENLAHGTWVSSVVVAKDDHTGMVGLAPHCKAIVCSQGMLEHKLLQLQQAFFRDHPSASMVDFQTEMVKHQEELQSFGSSWSHYQFHGAAQSIRYLVDHNAKVINISSALERSLCGSAEVWDDLEAAFAYAAEKQVVIVLAAGNNAANWEQYPGKKSRPSSWER
jgi:subtilisin family serine protease